MRVSVEMLEEDVLWKNTQKALVHPVEGKNNSDSWNCQKEEVSCLVRKMTAKIPLPEALRKLCEEIQYDLTKEEKRQQSGLLRKHSFVFQLDGEPHRKTDRIRHDIKTNSHIIRQPTQRYPTGLREEGEKHSRDARKGYDRAGPQLSGQALMDLLRC